MNFSSRFAELRTDNDVKQKDLAKLLNVSVSAVSHYEKGLNTPDLSNLILLADYFNVSLDYLVGRSSYKNTALLNTELPLPDGTISCGQILDRLLALPSEQQNDIVRHLNVLYNSMKK